LFVFKIVFFSLFQLKSFATAKLISKLLDWNSLRSLAFIIELIIGAKRSKSISKKPNLFFSSKFFTTLGFISQITPISCPLAIIEAVLVV